MRDQLPPAHQTERLITEMMRFKDDPYQWVMWAFPWGKKNTPLQFSRGPRQWQKEVLLDISKFIKENVARFERGEETEVYKLGVSSGRGIGKSSLIGWLALWIMSCHFGSTTVITANTDSQLSDRTFGEIGRWYSLLINGYWFERLAKSIQPADWFATQVHRARGIDKKYWYVNGELWNEDNPDAFAGVHNMIGTMYIFDEASGIPAPIWKVTEGVFTENTPYKFHLVFSNPRSNSGPFWDIFYNEDHAKYWRTRKIDSRTVEGVPQNTYKEIIAKYGEDSREARIEVRGEFPIFGDKQFVSRSIVLDALNRDLEKIDDYAPLLMGVDPARFGDDQTVIRFRKGRDARSYPPVTMKNMDTMAVANKVAELIGKFNPDGVFIDIGGLGAGVFDRLKEMGYVVFDVTFGSRPEDDRFFDRRTELWARLRDWLPGAMLPNPKLTNLDDDKKLIEDMVAPEWSEMGRENKIKLESKDSMKRRRVSSPDNADALALTFDRPVARKDIRLSRTAQGRSPRIAHGTGGDVKFD